MQMFHSSGGYRVHRWAIPGVLLMALLLALMAALLLTVVPAHAQTSVQTQSQQAVVVQQRHDRWQYNRGWQAGYRDTVRACIYGQHNQLRAQAVQKAHLNAYQRGYLDGVDAALNYSRACQPHHRR